MTVHNLRDAPPARKDPMPTPTPTPLHLRNLRDVTVALDALEADVAKAIARLRLALAKQPVAGMPARPTSLDDVGFVAIVEEP